VGTGQPHGGGTRTWNWECGQQPGGGRVHFVRRQIPHTPVVKRAGPQLARPARDRFLKVDRPSRSTSRSTRYGSGRTRLTTGRPNAAAKCRGPLSVVTNRSSRRTTAFVNPSDNGLSHNETTFGLRLVSAIRRAISRSAGPQSTHQPPHPCRWRAPGRGRRTTPPARTSPPRTPPGVQPDHPRVVGQPEPVPHDIGRRLVRGRGEQLHPVPGGRALP